MSFIFTSRSRVENALRVAASVILLAVAVSPTSSAVVCLASDGETCGCCKDGPPSFSAACCEDSRVAEIRVFDACCGGTEPMGADADTVDVASCCIHLDLGVEPIFSECSPISTEWSRGSASASLFIPARYLVKHTSPPSNDVPSSCSPLHIQLCRLLT